MEYRILIITGVPNDLDTRRILLSTLNTTPFYFDNYGSLKNGEYIAICVETSAHRFKDYIRPLKRLIVEHFIPHGYKLQGTMSIPGYFDIYAMEYNFIVNCHGKEVFRFIAEPNLWIQ